jgi:hypothetical protein
MLPAIPNIANAPIFDLLNLKAPRMNGWLARNVAVYAFAQVQHFFPLRAHAAQNRNVSSGLSWYLRRVIYERQV